MKKLLFFILIPFISWSQELLFVSEISLDADVFVGIDSYNDTFYIKDQVLYKKTKTNLFTFNDIQLGAIFSVDIVNPLKIVVYYQDFNTAVILDNTLAEIERINFNTLSEFINTSQVAMAANNSLWLFNVDSQQLERYNYRLKTKTLVSQPINGELLSMASDFNYCFVLTKDKIRAYNIYGSLLTEINSNEFQKIVQHNENILALKNNTLYYIEKDSKKIIKIKTPEISIKDLQLTQDYLYIYNGKNIQYYKLTNTK